MHGAELVDLEISPHERKARRWRRTLHIGLPIVAVALLIGAIFGIALYSYESNRHGASVLSDDLLRSLEARIGTEVATYLEPAPKMVEFARQSLAGGAFSPDGIARVERFGRNVLQTYKQIAAFFVADGEGQFLMVRGLAEGGTETKRITIASDGTRQVHLSRRDVLGQIVEEGEVRDDFDPRTRPWYQGAVEARDAYWTDVYVFYSEHAPGVTTALPRLSDDGSINEVYGIDITLAALSRFLGEIEIGATGRALIVDADGKLIAFPDPDRVLREEDGKLITQRLDELGDIALTRAFNRFRIEGHGHGTIDVGGEAVIYASTALPIAAGKDWSVLIVVPEREIIGFVAANNRTALLLSLSIIAVAALLAGLLVRQGIRADRNARLVEHRQEAIETQSRAFSDLASSVALFDPDDQHGISTLSEALADVTGARRVSVWRLARGGRSLMSEEIFDRTSRIHTDGVELHRAELPKVWAGLHAGELFDIADAAQDARADKLFHAYLEPLGIRALMTLPIKRGDEVVGSIWLEDLPPAGQRAAGIESFARTAAHLAAIRVAAPGRDRSAPHAGTAPDKPAEISLAGGRTGEPAFEREEPYEDRVLPGTPVSRRETAVDPSRQDLLQRRTGADEPAADGAEAYPALTVLTVLLPDVAEAAAVGGIVRVLEDAAEAHVIPYLKVLGNSVVAAAGFSGDPALAASAIAQASLSIRESDGPSARRLRMGIDTGPAQGGSVGLGGRCYNLSGTAIRRASEMAQTAPLGSIQATDFAYAHLSGKFLFRPRATFYTHPEGETATYLLAGQL